MIKRLFADEVALFMRLSYHPLKATASDFARTFKCDRRTIERLLIGSTYSDVPEALGPLVTVRGNCYLSDEMVLKARRAFRRKTATIRALAKRYDVDTMVMSRAIRGLTYTHLPLAVKGKIKHDRTGIGRSTPKAREEQIVRVRQRVADPNDPFTREDAARELGVGDSSVVRYLTGQRYPHLPHAVPLKLITKYGYNACTFTPEQVVAIRTDYRKPKVTLTGLADSYGVSREVIEFVLDGTKYPEIPGVMTAAEIAAKKNRRTMTDAQVLQARRRFKTRYVTVHEIAVEFGMSIQGAENMLRGFSYKDVPEAVPDHIKPLRRGRNFVPKKLRAKYRLPPQAAVPFLAAAE